MWLNPSAVLARSHVSFFVIHPTPSSSVHLPDDRREGNATKTFPSLPQRLIAALQKKPVAAVQSTALQPHTPEFFVMPDSSEHAAAWLQVLEVALHTMPVPE